MSGACYVQDLAQVSSKLMMIEFAGHNFPILPLSWNEADYYVDKFYSVMPLLPITLSTINKQIYEGYFTINFMNQISYGFISLINDTNNEEKYVFPSKTFSICLDDKLYTNFLDMLKDIDWNVKERLDMTIIFGNVDCIFDVSYGFDIFGSLSDYWGDDLFKLLKPYYKTKCPEEISNVVMVKRMNTQFYYPRKLVPSRWKYDEHQDIYYSN